MSLQLSMQSEVSTQIYLSCFWWWSFYWERGRKYTLQYLRIHFTVRSEVHHLYSV